MESEVMMLKKVGEGMEKLNKRFDGMEQSFDVMQGRFDVMERRFGTMEGHFDAMEKRFDGVDERFEGVDRQFEKIDKRFEGLETKMDEGFRHQGVLLEVMQGDINTLVDGHEVLHERIDRLQGTVSGIEVKVDDIDMRLTGVEAV